MAGSQVVQQVLVVYFGIMFFIEIVLCALVIYSSIVIYTWHIYV